MFSRPKGINSSNGMRVIPSDTHTATRYGVCGDPSPIQQKIMSEEKKSIIDRAMSFVRGDEATPEAEEAEVSAADAARAQSPMNALVDA